MNWFDALVVVIIVLPILDWVVATILVLAAFHTPRSTALTERAVSAVVLAGAATLAAGLGWLRLTETRVPSEVALYILAAILLGVSIPAAVWLYKFVRGDFK